MVAIGFKDQGILAGSLWADGAEEAEGFGPRVFQLVLDVPGDVDGVEGLHFGPRIAYQNFPCSPQDDNGMLVGMALSSGKSFHFQLEVAEDNLGTFDKDLPGRPGKTLPICIGQVGHALPSPRFEKLLN